MLDARVDANEGKAYVSEEIATVIVDLNRRGVADGNKRKRVLI